MTVRVKNWSKFQHFKDRKPPWVKLYRDLLDDMEWHRLDAKAAKALVMLWLIASENDGDLPDVETLAFRLRTTETEVKTTMSKLSHWLDQSDDKLISSRHQHDPLETETETETETEPRKRSKPAGFTLPDWINRAHWDAWHSCPKRKKATDAQKQLAVDKLDTWRQAGEDHAGALENAAVGGWQGLFLPDKAKQNPADIARFSVPSRPGKDPTLIAIEEHEATVKPMSPEIRQALREAAERMRA